MRKFKLESKNIGKLTKEKIEEITKNSMIEYDSLKELDIVSLFGLFKFLAQPIEDSCYITDNELILAFKGDINNKLKEGKIISVKEFIKLKEVDKNVRKQ